jgi:amino acid adenylation domain-containing protein/FkbM family methyltransferase
MTADTVEGYRLSPQQRLLWPRARGTGAYRVRGAVSLAGPCSNGALRAAAQAVLARHEILRTRFVFLPGMDLPVQVIDEHCALPWHEVDLRAVAPERQTAAVDAVHVQLRRFGFDPAAAPAVRFCLLLLAPQRRLLIASLPALCCDPTSLFNLCHEICQPSDGRTGGGGPGGEPIQYVQFAEWHNNFLADPAEEDGRRFWRQRQEAAHGSGELSGPSPTAAEPPARPAWARFRWLLDDAMASPAQSHPEAAPTLLVACWMILQWRLSGKREVLVACQSQGRAFAELASCLGLFARYLPTPLTIAPQARLDELLERVGQALAEGESWQEHFAGEGGAGSGGGVAFDFCRWPPAGAAGRLRVAWELLEHRLAGFDLRLSVDQFDGGHAATLDYDPARLGRRQALRLAGQFSALVASALERPQCLVCELSSLSAAERQQLLHEWNDTGREAPGPALIHRLFEAQARRTPDAPAVEHAGSVLSYGALDRRASELAAALRRRGVGPERRVALYLHRGVDLLVALLATLKAGGAYVPVEAACPPGRLAALLADCRPTLLLTQAALAPRLPPATVPCCCLDADWAALAGEGRAGRDEELSPDNLAYLIYTSGTAGKPKGVGISHRSAANLAFALRLAIYGDAPGGCRVTLNAPIAFDASVKQVLQLLSGHCLHIVPEEVRLDGERLVGYLAEQAVDVLDCTPSQLKLLHAGGAGGTPRLPLRLLLVGGEVVDPPTWRLMSRQEPMAAFNLYGPTECTVDATAGRARPHLARPSVGPPLANVEVYVLDPWWQPVPGGGVGELCIGGAGLARGYFADPAGTAASFVPHPFAAGRRGARLYRTGDLARIHGHGEIEVLGRRDRQIKLRGFRVELEEIEAVLAQHPAVREAAVAAREDGTGHPQIVAYVVAAGQGSGDAGGQRHYELPNGLAIVHQNRNETDYLYQEIFAKGIYLQHGIVLPEAACVFDVGANIGLFSLFVAQRCPGARIHAFEPIPRIYQDLRRNLERHVPRARAYNLGLASAECEETFTYYPHYSMMSGLRSYADADYDREVVKVFIANEQRQLAGDGGSELLLQADQLLAARFAAEAQLCRLTRLSRFLAAEGIEQIDLLKIDVQRAELDVLRGIDAADWDKIGQIVMEVHDRPGTATAGRLQAIEGLLAERGFAVAIAQDELLEGTDRYNLYAWRPALRHSARYREPSLAPPAVIPAAIGAAPDTASPESLRDFLRHRLPEYMVPSAFVRLPSLPLTSGGKVDYRLLPAPAAAGPTPVAVAPRNPRERILAEVWAEVLGVEGIGVRDNFFDHGGDSIRSIRVRALAERRGLLFSAGDLLECQTIEELARRAEESGAGLPEEGATAPFSLLAEADRRLLPGGVEDAYPLALLQAGMLFHSAMTPGRTAYHNVNSLHLRAPFDEERLRLAIAALLARHPALRTAFDLTSYSEPLQLVFRHPEMPLSIHDLRGLPAAEQERLLDLAVEQQRRRSFDWTRAPLVRFEIHRRGPDSFQLTWAEHHAILDGWSLASMVAELLRDVLSPAPPRKEEPPPAVAFRDFVARERQALAQESCRRFWADRLAGAVPTRLPRAARAAPAPAPAERQMRAHRELLPPALAARLRELARAAAAPLKSVLLAAHLRVLALESGRTEVLTGLVANARPETEGGDRAFGLFLNTLPFHARLSGGSWLQLVQATLREEQELWPYRQYPVAEITRRRSGGPLFETLFNYTHFHVLREILGLSEVEVLDRRSIVVDLGLTLVTDFSLSPESDSLELHLAHDAQELPRHHVESIGGHYCRTLAAMAEDPAAPYETSLLLSAAERQQVLVEWIDSASASPRGRALHRLFGEQAGRTPDAVAVRAPTACLTYAELDRQARRLAHRLRALGIGPEDRVGICLERTAEMVVAVLGVLAAGGAYVPLDPANPPQRLEFMMRDAGVGALIASPGTAPRQGSGGPAPALELLTAQGLPDPGAGDLPDEVEPENLAYVIYTSGSTGRPKGVAISHRSAVALVSWAVSYFSPARLAGVLAASGLGFDLSVFEIFAPLACGGCVVLAKHALELPDLPAAGTVTLLNTVPSVLAELLRQGGVPAGLRTVTLAGEALPRALVDGLFQQTAVREAFNLYGPSEDTTFSTAGRIEPASSGAPPIGRPIDDTAIYLLDPHLAPVPAGVAGELFLGGEGLARGYLARPELTAERFAPRHLGGAPGSRLYRTGDLARHRHDGQLEFLGRADQQVKLWGLRIELGEIEAALAAHPAVRAVAVALTGQAAGAPRLAAFVVAAEQPGPGAEELRRFLRQRLPEPMIPALFVPLAALPLTARGKLDRAALAVPETPAAAAGEPFVAPRDRLEIVLAQIWEELLEVAPIGVRDDFFALGGHSILALRLMARLGQRYGRTLPLAELLRRPTVESLAMAWRGPQRPGATSSLIAVQPRGGGKPLVCVHPVGGNVLCYYGLGRALAAARPLYAFQARGIEGEAGPLSRIEDMAARYVEELEAFDSDGPYLLSGWSMGGLVAFEMTRQLQRRGHRVALLALLDAAAPPGPGDRWPPLAADPVLVFARDLGLTAELPGGAGQLAPPDLESQLAFVLEQAKRAQLLPPAAEMPEIDRAFAVFVANLRAVETYRPEPISVKISLFRSPDPVAAAPRPRDLGWSRLALGGVEVIATPGDHYTMLRGDHLRVLAGRLEACVQSALETPVEFLLPAQDAARRSAPGELP